MSTRVVIYHNPRCSKSRQTLELLRSRGIEPEIVEYLDDPPSAARVKELVKLLGIEPHALLRTKEAPYAEVGLSKNSTLDEIAKAVARHPILLERPIVVRGSKAALGRPPENVLSLLDKA
jgi:arsenate reductase